MKEYTLRKQPSTKDLSDLVAQLGSKVLATVFWHRGLKTSREIEEFTSQLALLPLGELYNVSAFFDRIKYHMDKKSKVAIYGDYDADGAVAAAILWRFLAKELEMNVTVYIPDRHEEGYGLNKQALDTLASQKIDLVITVDCGVRDSVLIEEVTSQFPMEIIVTDHHQPGDTFPKCVVVHPLFPGHESSNKYISGGVVVWKTVRYVEDRLGISHQYSDSVVDLAGTSLVTDIMPLVGENRVILKLAIQKMRSSPSLGLKVLSEVAQVQVAQLSAYHLGYVIGPRLNASGRIGNQYTSTRLLSTDNEQNARKYAQETHEINVKRQGITKQMFDEAEAIKIVLKEKLIVVAKEGWDDGIIGLVAGKLMNVHNLPTLAISVDTEKRIAKGSARSFGEFDITDFLSKFTDTFERYGGHQNAAGFTLSEIDMSKFIGSATRVLESHFSHYIPKARAFVDSYVTSTDLTEQFFEQLSKLEPFGQANFAPLFAMKGKVGQFSVFGQQGTHLRVDLQTDTGTTKALAFDSLRLLKDLHQGDEVILIGKPKLDEYQGKKQTTFFIEDVVTHLKEEE